ncbi:hypothetical protein ACRZOU_002124 [Aeromonas salmonicida]
MTNMSRDLEGHQQGTQNVSIPYGTQKIATPPKRRVRSAAKVNTKAFTGLLLIGQVSGRKGRGLLRRIEHE